MYIQFNFLFNFIFIHRFQLFEKELKSLKAQCTYIRIVYFLFDCNQFSGPGMTFFQYLK